MNDRELIDRLRRSLRERADGLQPAPGGVPAFGRQEAAGADAAGSGARSDGARSDGARSDSARSDSADGAGVAGAADGADGERRTAEYALLPPTGPVRILGGGRRRWPPLVGLGAVVAAAAGIAVAVAVSQGGRPVTVRPNDTGLDAPASAPPTAAPVPTTVASPPATALPAVVSAVPAGFTPYSVTFISVTNGWALGWTPCTTGSCATVAATTDGGERWNSVGAPAIAFPTSSLSGALGGPPYFQIRFADLLDGWIWTAPGASQLASSLWSTHDGGQTWTAQPVPLAGGTIAALEAAGGAGGIVNAVVYGRCPATEPGCQGQFEETILTSPVGRDSWTTASVHPNVGAGPDLSPQLTLWGTQGWLINDNRTAVSGARLRGPSTWSAWSPPCATANGSGLLGAASATDLVAVCAEGAYGTPDAGTQADREYLFRSTDGGSHFGLVGPVPGGPAQSMTVAPGKGQTIVVSVPVVGLEASFDGGQHWSTVLPLSAIGGTQSGFGYVGFTSATQGVAVLYQLGAARTLYLTRDGGHDWAPVTF